MTSGMDDNMTSSIDEMTSSMNEMTSSIDALKVYSIEHLTLTLALKVYPCLSHSTPPTQAPYGL